MFRLLEDTGADAVGAVEEEAERLRGWIGSVRVTPRFRTPRHGFFPAEIYRQEIPVKLRNRSVHPCIKTGSAAAHLS